MVSMATRSTWAAKIHVPTIQVLMQGLDNHRWGEATSFLASDAPERVAAH